MFHLEINQISFILHNLVFLNLVTIRNVIYAQTIMEIRQNVVDKSKMINQFQLINLSNLLPTLMMTTNALETKILCPEPTRSQSFYLILTTTIF